MKLTIENLPLTISKSHLETALLPHGWFDAIRLVRNPATGEPVALVETCVPAEATRLLRRLDGGEIFGRRIRVRPVAEGTEALPGPPSPKTVGSQGS